MIKLSKKRLLKIFTFYWDTACKYKVDNRWVHGTVGIKAIPYIERGECVLLLKPLLMLSGPEILKLEQLAENMESADSEDSPKEEQIVIEPKTRDEVRDSREHLMEMIDTAPYPVVDYLRKEGYHVPIYGIDLFKAKLAEWPTDKTKKKTNYAGKESKRTAK